MSNSGEKSMTSALGWFVLAAAIVVVAGCITAAWAVHEVYTSLRHIL